MNALLLTVLLVGSGAVPGGQDDCLSDTAVEPGRWQVESVREGEPPVPGVADIVHWQDGCVLLERLVIHFDDGSSHHTIFVQGTDSAEGGPQLLQIGDHPLFLTWRPTGEGETYRTRRSTDGGSVELRWRVRPAGAGFERELFLRREGESAWTSSEVIRYTPLSSADGPDDVPPRRPGPFHDPDACAAPDFRAMDHLLGSWLSEEWVRQGEGWTAGTVSEVSVRSVIGGCALMEEHPIYEDGVLADRLLLFRAYVPSRDRWRQIVFSQDGGVREWDLERSGEAWVLAPARGEMEGRLRILERSDSTGVRKTIQQRSDDGGWQTRRLIRYVAW